MSVDSLTLVAVGDISFNGHYHRLLPLHGSDYPFRAVAPLWRDADLRLGNLESPITDSPRFAPDKCTLRGPVLAVDSLRRVGFDCVSLANNHMMDFGPAGMTDTSRALSSAGIAHVGAGETASEAYAPVVLMVRGHAVGILAFCDVVQTSPLYAGHSSPGVAEGRPEVCVDRIRALRPRVDWLVVLMHWGTEMSQLPSLEQRAWAHQMVDAGADLILGHHPHVLQPMELINGVPVFYSLGNFLFSGMFWRGQNPTNGDRFAGKVRIAESSRKTGWAEIVLQRGKPTGAVMRHARLSRGLAVEPDDTALRQEGWAELTRRLSSKNYAEAFEFERGLAQQRRKHQTDSRSLPRRIEIALFRHRLLPGAIEV